MLLEISWTIEFFPSLVPAKAPASPAGVFFSHSVVLSPAGSPRRAAPLCPAQCVRDREARADGQGRELIDRVAAGAPIRQLLAVEALGQSADACALAPSTNPP
jgi:hypothetical protein